MMMKIKKETDPVEEEEPSASTSKTIMKDSSDPTLIPKGLGLGEPRVVAEFPVFLSKSLMDQLCLLQYPQRPAHVETNNVLTTKVKPKQTKMQVTFGLDCEGEAYDPETGELLAEAEQGIGLDEDQYMPDHCLKLEKMTMESTSVPRRKPERYAVGVLNKGVLTLTPVKKIVQMKTVFPYLNKADKARRAYEKQKEGGGDSQDEDDNAPSTSAEVTKVTVKFSRTGTTGRMSALQAKKREDEEPWVDMEYVSKDKKEFEKLFKNDQPTMSTPMLNVLPKKDYLSGLFPKHVEVTGDSGQDEKKKRKNPKVSIQQMRQMTLPEQLKILMINAKVLQYHQIVEFLRLELSTEVDGDTLLKTIPSVAILVQGCWVVRSDIIYPEDFKSSANGVSGQVMQKGRDLILSQFTDYRFVERKRMVTLTKLPSEEVSEILQQFSRSVPKKGWEFLLPYDAAFVSKHPEVADRQSMMWQMKKQQRIRHESTSTQVNPSPPNRRKSRTKSISSSGEDTASETEGSRRRRQSESVGGGGRNRHRRNSTRSEIAIPPTRVQS